MKISSLILVLTALFAFNNTNAQEKYLPISQTPEQIISYVKTNFPKSKIVSVKKDKEILNTEYEVRLNTMVGLEFDGNFSIKKIESKTSLPKTVIPKL